MEVMEDFTASNDLSMIIKGRRTKRRQRPLSPPVCPSSSVGGEDAEVLGYFCSLIPYSTTSTSDISTTTFSTDQEDDDQDIANCLILLAQGESVRRKNLSHHHQDDVEMKMEKFTSRRFNEMASSTTGGKVSYFVYECKTCNRTFPSFQALGGHRASHKKPKIATEEKKTAVNIDPEEEYLGEQSQSNRPTPNPNNLSIHSANKCLERNNNINVNKSKIHECSLCGAEFASGQALGGHMRRHRNPLASTKLSMSVGTTTHEDDESFQDLKKPKNIFPLDLNLPAPVDQDDYHRDSKFHQHHLVFPAPALVDCYY